MLQKEQGKFHKWRLSAGCFRSLFGLFPGWPNDPMLWPALYRSADGGLEPRPSVRSELDHAFGFGFPIHHPDSKRKKLKSLY
jgi:hypothetical protein